MIHEYIIMGNIKFTYTLLSYNCFIIYLFIIIISFSFYNYYNLYYYKQYNSFKCSLNIIIIKRFIYLSISYLL